MQKAKYFQENEMHPIICEFEIQHQVIFLLLQYIYCLDIWILVP